jgi:hypothetical protein
MWQPPEVPMARKAKKSRKKSKTPARSRGKSARRSSAPRKKTKGRAKGRRRWSQRVTEESDALDLENKVFAQNSPKKIAASLKRSAERSQRRKSAPYRSAMSMLSFYINRAGRNLPASRKRILNKAKDELRALFGRP